MQYIVNHDKTYCFTQLDYRRRPSPSSSYPVAPLPSSSSLLPVVPSPSTCRPSRRRHRRCRHRPLPYLSSSPSSSTLSPVAPSPSLLIVPSPSSLTSSPVAPSPSCHRHQRVARRAVAIVVAAHCHSRCCRHHRQLRP